MFTGTATEHVAPDGGLGEGLVLRCQPNSSESLIINSSFDSIPGVFAPSGWNRLVHFVVQQQLAASILVCFVFVLAMAIRVLHLQFRRLFFTAPQTQQAASNVFPFSGKKGISLKFVDGDRRKAKKRKPRLSISTKAASSPSPALGGSYSAEDYEQLLGAEQKRKQSVAGTDQDELLDPVHLADPDSCFCEFRGVQVHYKVCEPESEPGSASSLHKQTPSQFDLSKRIGFPMILLHGFGASVFSWHRVMKPLSHIVGSKVLAFDRPAFGLTSRVSHSRHPHADGGEMSLNPYSAKFSELTTLYFVDFLASDKAILVGHSAGSLTAVGTYFEAPDRVAALILVAPAIFAPLSNKKVTKENDVKMETQIKENEADTGKNAFASLRQIFSKALEFVAVSVIRLARGMMDMANTIYRKALYAILRSSLAVMLVRMIINKFGIAAVKNSWYDATQITDLTLNGYTKPLKTKGWDKALVEYTVAMLMDSATESKPDPIKRLNEISCPVLIITGDSDRLVPAWNSKRLASVIPDAQLEIIQKCGHLPHEERPEEFMLVVEKFLQRVFAGSGEWCLQA